MRDAISSVFPIVSGQAGGFSFADGGPEAIALGVLAAACAFLAVAVLTFAWTAGMNARRLRRLARPIAVPQAETGPSVISMALMNKGFGPLIVRKVRHLRQGQDEQLELAEVLPPGPDPESLDPMHGYYAMVSPVGAGEVVSPGERRVFIHIESAPSALDMTADGSTAWAAMDHIAQVKQSLDNVVLEVEFEDIFRRPAGRVRLDLGVMAQGLRPV